MLLLLLPLLLPPVAPGVLQGGAGGQSGSSPLPQPEPPLLLLLQHLPLYPSGLAQLLEGGLAWVPDTPLLQGVLVLLLLLPLLAVHLLHLPLSLPGLAQQLEGGLERLSGTSGPSCPN